MIYEKGDMVSFKLTREAKYTYSGIIVSRWRINNRYAYEIASMNHGMCSFTIGQQCILKKIS